MSSHSFARTLKDETGYGAGGRWSGRLPLGVLSPRMSLVSGERKGWIMSVKLTDAQLVMMSAAAQREDRCLAAPETMKGAVVSKAGAKLVKLGFAREIHAKPGTPLWRRDETGRSFALKLTAAGLKAIAVDEGPQDVIEPGEASQPQLLPEAKNGVSLDDVGRHALRPLRETAASWR